MDSISNNYIFFLITEYLHGLFHFLNNSNSKRTILLASAAGNAVRCVTGKQFIMIRNRLRHLPLGQTQVQELIYIRHIDPHTARGAMPAVHAISMELKLIHPGKHKGIIPLLTGSLIIESRLFYFGFAVTACHNGYNSRS